MRTYLPQVTQLDQAQAYFDRYPEELEYETDDGFEIVKTTDGTLYTLIPLPAKDSPLDAYQSLAISPEGRRATLTWNMSLSSETIQISAQTNYAPSTSTLLQYIKDKALAHDFFKTFPHAIKLHRNIRKQASDNSQGRLSNTKISAADWETKLNTNDTHNSQIPIAQWIQKHNNPSIITSFRRNPIDHSIFPLGKERGRGAYGVVKESVSPNGKRRVIKIINLTSMTKLCKSQPTIDHAQRTVGLETDTLYNVGQIKAPPFNVHDHHNHIHKSIITLDDLGHDLFTLLTENIDQKNTLPPSILLNIMMNICHLFIDYSLGRCTHDLQPLLQRDIKPENIMFNRSGGRKEALTDWGFAQTSANLAQPRPQGTELYLHSTMHDPEATNEEVDIVSLLRTFHFEPHFNTQARLGLTAPSLTDLNHQLEISHPSLLKLLTTANLERSNDGRLCNTEFCTKGLLLTCLPKTLLELGARIAWVALFNDDNFIQVRHHSPEKQEATFLLAKAGVSSNNARFIQGEEENIILYRAIIILGRFDLQLLKRAEHRIRKLTLAEALDDVIQQAQHPDLKTERQYQQLLNDYDNPNFFKRAIIALSELDASETQTIWQNAIIENNIFLQRLICYFFLKSKDTTHFTPSNLTKAAFALAIINNQEGDSKSDSFISLIVTLKSLNYTFDTNKLINWIMSPDPHKTVLSQAYFSSLARKGLSTSNLALHNAIFYLHQADISIENPLLAEAFNHNSDKLHMAILFIASFEQATTLLREASNYSQHEKSPTLSLYIVILKTTLRLVLAGDTKDKIKRIYANDALNTIDNLPEDRMQAKLRETTAILSHHQRFQFDDSKRTQAYLDAEPGLHCLVRLTELPSSLFNKAILNKDLPGDIQTYSTYKQQVTSLVA